MSRVEGDLPDQGLTFGPFRLLKARKLLLEGTKPVRLGSRAFDLLVALVERAGDIVSREELEACAWPTTIVEETNLRVHVSALRKALGDGHGGARFITNVPGRGYCFVAPVGRPAERHAGVSEHAASHNLPVRLTQPIGRTEAVASLIGAMAKHRFVTIAGPGGMGKTTVSLAMAEELLASFEHGVWLVELAPVTEPDRLAGVVASTLGISVPAESPLPALTASLVDKNILIVLDNCDHLIDATASLAESLLKASAGISVLATSREPLNAEGEWIFQLPPLGMPPESDPLTAAEALAFPAVQLFVQRAMASSDRFELSDDDAPIVRTLCRQLDGIPLAIEFAAARVDTLGVSGLELIRN